MLVSAQAVLQEFANGPLGAVALAGLDAGARGQYYLGAVLLAFALFCLPFRSGNWYLVFDRESVDPAVGGSNSLAQLGLVIALANLVLFLWSGDALFLRTVVLLFGLLLIGWRHGREVLVVALLAHQVLLLLMLLSGWRPAAWVIVLCLLVPAALSSRISERRAWLEPGANRGLVLALILAPACLLVSRELNYAAGDLGVAGEWSILALLTATAGWLASRCQ